jgi:hypothetical protein
MGGQVPHGTQSGYSHHGCRCVPCTQANTDYGNARNRLIAYGRWNPHGDLAELRGHVRMLIAAEWSPRRIDACAGVWQGCASRILTDDSYRPARSTADRVLAVQPTSGPLLMRAAFGSMRRLRCLCAIGYGLPWVSDKTGLGEAGLSAIRRGARTKVEAATHDAIEAVYAEWSERPAPAAKWSAVARAAARREGWGTPAAWDTEWLDMSPAELDEEMGRLVGQMDKAERKRWWRAVREGELSPLALAAAGVPRGRGAVEVAA